jgi:dihydrofolate synthase/folylpolyglutamate synthase
MPNHQYQATLERLFRLRRFGARPGLEVIRGLLHGLGDPQASFRAVHVAGSKGKGSVAAMTSSILAAHGRATGLFTSPHLQSYCERVRTNTGRIEPSDVVAGVHRIEEIATKLVAEKNIGQSPTFFEVTTALAFDWFARQGVSDAVIEVGLGGRLDSTNVLRSPIGVITTIEYEHTEVLGSTIREIASEKAGILHPGMHAIVGDLPSEAWEEIHRTALAHGVPIWRLGHEIAVGDREIYEGGQRIDVRVPNLTLRDLEIPLQGTFQSGNAALAIAAACQFGRAEGFEVTENEIRRGLASVVWRGRLERVARRPDLIVDVAHTLESARAVVRSLAEIYPTVLPHENVLVFGCLQGKPADSILDALSPLARTVVVVPVRSDRARPPEELRRLATGVFARMVQAPSLALGLELGRAATGAEGFTLVTGSDYLVGEVLDLISGALPSEPDLSDPGILAPRTASRRRQSQAGIEHT